MQSADDKITELIGKGADLNQDDLDAIEYLLTQGDTDTAFERRGAVMEAVSLIVNDPLYEGDISPIE